MKRLMLILLAVAALSFAAAGTARADDTATVDVQCSDGTTWVLDPAMIDVASFGEALCGDFVVLTQDDAAAPAPDATAAPDSGAGDFSLSSAIAPDPTAYVTEVQCPNGQIWAVARGDDFVCPAA